MRKLIVIAIAGLTLSGCDVSAPGDTERTALLAPDFVAHAAARTTDDSQAKWLLHQPKPVRESYVHGVMDKHGDRDLLAQAWLLTQSQDVRISYVREVVVPQLEKGP